MTGARQMSLGRGWSEARADSAGLENECVLEVK